MQEEGGEVRSRVAPGLGSRKKNCGVSSLFLAFEQEGVKREEGTGAGRKGEAREWIMKGKKILQIPLQREREHSTIL